MKSRKIRTYFRFDRNNDSVAKDQSLLVSKKVFFYFFSFLSDGFDPEVELELQREDHPDHHLGQPAFKTFRPGWHHNDVIASFRLSFFLQILHSRTQSDKNGVAKLRYADFQPIKLLENAT